MLLFLRRNIIILSFLHLLYHEDNNISHIKLLQQSKEKEQLLTYKFSHRGRKLNDQKQDFTILSQISNTLFLSFASEFVYFCEATSQYIHFVHLHTVGLWDQIDF